MKILELDLRACGPFTDLRLDLSEGNRGFHLIHGVNEAGKSSTLRAIRYLLFGFPNRVGDDFLHPYDALRVGALLAADDDAELGVLRRKGNKNSLRDLADSVIVDDAVLRKFLGGVSETRFTTLFGIDHATLVEGGREIASGNGDAGEILVAGAGVGNIRDLQRKLDEESDKLFAPKGRTKPLNLLLSEIDAAKQAGRKGLLHAQDWLDKQQELADVDRQKETLEAALREQRVELARLSRWRAAGPKAAEYAERLREKEGVADAPQLSANFSTRRADAEKKLYGGRLAQQRSTEKIQKLRAQHDAIQLSPQLCEHKERILELSRKLGAEQKAGGDRARLESQWELLEQDAVDLLRQLGRSQDEEDPVLPAGRRELILQLVQDGSLTLERAAAARKAAAAQRRRCETAMARLHAAPARRDLDPLRLACSAARRLGDVDKAVSQTRIEQEVSRKKIDRELSQLQPWRGTLEELRRLSLPSEETIERFRGDWNKIAEWTRDARKQLDASRAQLEDLDARLEQFNREGDVPTEQSLLESREGRDRVWRHLQAAWSDKATDERRETLSRDFEAAMRTADETADRLRREAKRVAQLAEISAQRSAAQVRLERTQATMEQAEAQAKQLQSEWLDQWASFGASPFPPGEMAAWMIRRDKLTETADLWEARETSLNEAIRTRDEHAARLKRALDELDENAATADSLSELLVRAEETLITLESRENDRRALEGEIDRLHKEAAQADDDSADAERTAMDWRRQWEQAVADLPIDDKAPPAQASTLLDLFRRLEEKRREARDKKKRIEAIKSDNQKFKDKVRELVRAVAADLVDGSEEYVLDELGRRLSKATQAAGDAQLLAESLAEEAQALDHATEEVREAEAELAALCREASCQDPSLLREAEERANRRRIVEERVGRLQTDLLALSAGQPLAEFLLEVRSTNCDELPARIRELEEQIEAADRRLKDELGPTRGKLLEQIEQMRIGSQAADAADNTQDLLAKLAVGAEEWARFKLARFILQKGVERYCSRNQEPIVQRAGEIFARLTARKFDGLRLDYNEVGEGEIVGVRAPSGRKVSVGSMSDGTADQLYLAVRIALVERYLDDHESIPFIVDDVLIRFDDARSACTLEVLAELSTRTQVLFFTHHPHLVALAERRLDPTVLFVHPLDESVGDRQGPRRRGRSTAKRT